LIGLDDTVDIDLVDNGAHVAPGYGLHAHRAQRRKHKSAYECVALSPTLVSLLGVFFNVTLCQFGKSTGTTFGSPLGLRVTTANDFKHQLCGKSTRFRETNRMRSADGKPTWPIMMTINQLVAAVATWLHQQRQAALVSVPHQIRLGGGRYLGNRQRCQL